MPTIHDTSDVYDKETEASTPAAGGAHDNVDLSDDERAAFNDLAGDYDANSGDDGNDGKGGLYAGKKGDDDASSERTDPKTAIGRAARKLEDKKSAFDQKVNNKKKKLALAAGAASPIILLILIFLLFGNLKVIHYYETMFGYNYARAAKTSDEATAEVMSTADELQAAEDSRYAALKAKLGPIGDSLDRIRPEKIVRNLERDGQLDFKYTSTPRLGNSQLFAKRKLTAIEIEGQEIAVPNPRLRDWISNPIDTYKEGLAFKGSLKGAADGAMEQEFWWVRSLAEKKIFERANVKLRWFERFSSDYQAAKKAKAAGETNQNTLDDLENDARDVERNPARPDDAPPFLTKGTQQGVDDTRAAIKKCIDDPECLKQLNTGEMPDLIKKELTKVGDPILLESVLSKLGTVYGIMLPVCLILEGINPGNNEKKIDATDTALTVIGMGFNSAVNQVLSGAASAAQNAVIARKLDDTKTSVVDARNSGNGVTSTQPGPESDLNGVYGLEGNAIAKVLNSGGAKLLSTVCPVITDLRAAAALTIAEWAVIIATAGSEAGIDESVKLAVDAGTEEVVGAITKPEIESLVRFLAASGTEVGVEDIAVKEISKEAEGSFFKEAMSQIFNSEKDKIKDIFSREGAKKIAGQTALIFLARAHVLAVLQGSHVGTDRKSTYLDDVDQGNAINSRDVQRELSYGRPVTEAEQTSSAISDKTYLADKLNQQSTFDRYLALNGTSLVSNLGVSANMSLTRFAAHPAELFGSLIHGLGATLKSLAAVAFNMGGPRVAMAVAPSAVNPYHVVKFEWTDQELSYIGKKGYTVEENKDALGDNAAKVEDKYGKCWDASKASIGKLVANKDIDQTKTGDIKPNSGLCSPQNLGIGNSEFGPQMVFRYRLSKLYENQAEHMANASEVATSNPTPTNPGGGAPTGGVYMLGDSLTVGYNRAGISQDLQNAGYSGATINALGGRQLTAASAEVDKDSATIANSSTVVIALGTNQSGDQAAFTAQASALIDKIKGINPSATIEWVKVYYSTAKAARVRAVYDSYNQALDALVASKGIKTLSMVDAVGQPKIDTCIATDSSLIHPAACYPEFAQALAKLIAGSAP